MCPIKSCWYPWPMYDCQGQTLREDGRILVYLAKSWPKKTPREMNWRWGDKYFLAARHYISCKRKCADRIITMGRLMHFQSSNIHWAHYCLQVCLAAEPRENTMLIGTLQCFFSGEWFELWFWFHISVHVLWKVWKQTWQCTPNLKFGEDH